MRTASGWVERKRDSTAGVADAPVGRVGRVGRVVDATVSVAMTAKEKLRERAEASQSSRPPMRCGCSMSAMTR